MHITNAHSLSNKQDEVEVHARSESYGVRRIIEAWWENSHEWKTTMDGYNVFQKDMKRKRESGIDLHVKVKFECMEVSYGDHGSYIKCLWIKIGGIITMGDLR